MTTPREKCGTHSGLLLHAAFGEPHCGTCAQAEANRKLAVEAIPTRPSSVVQKRRASDWPDVTPEQAAQHCIDLLAETKGVA